MLEERFELELELWLEQKERRLSRGDDLSIPRQVDHLAIFRKLDNATKAAEDLTTIGYEVSVVKVGFSKFSLHATRLDALDDENFIQSLKTVVYVVEGNGGTYDGNGAPIINPEGDSLDEIGHFSLFKKSSDAIVVAKVLERYGYESEVRDLPPEGIRELKPYKFMMFSEGIAVDDDGSDEAIAKVKLVVEMGKGFYQGYGSTDSDTVRR